MTSFSFKPFKLQKLQDKDPIRPDPIDVSPRSSSPETIPDTCSSEASLDAQNIEWENKQKTTTTTYRQSVTPKELNKMVNKGFELPDICVAESVTSLDVSDDKKGNEGKINKNIMNNLFQILTTLCLSGFIAYMNPFYSAIIIYIMITLVIRKRSEMKNILIEGTNSFYEDIDELYKYMLHVCKNKNENLNSDIK